MTDWQSLYKASTDKSTTAEVLEELSNHPLVTVRMNVPSHINTSKATLEKLANDSDEIIANTAKARLRDGEELWFSKHIAYGKGKINSAK